MKRRGDGTRAINTICKRGSNLAMPVTHHARFQTEIDRKTIAGLYPVSPAFECDLRVGLFPPHRHPPLANGIARYVRDTSNARVAGDSPRRSVGISGTKISAMIDMEDAAAPGERFRQGRRFITVWRTPKSPSRARVGFLPFAG